MPLTIFENAAAIYRNHSLENNSFNRSSVDKENIGAFHNNAVDYLKQMGYSGKEIEESLKGTDTNDIYNQYKKNIDK